MHRSSIMPALVYWFIPHSLCLPESGGGGHRRGRVAFAALGNHLGQIRPRRLLPFAACLDHAGQQGVGAAALRTPRAVRDAAENHPMAQGAFGLVVGQRQTGVGQDDPNRPPVVEKFARQGSGLPVGGIPMPLAQSPKRLQGNGHSVRPESCP